MALGDYGNYEADETGMSMAEATARHMAATRAAGMGAANYAAMISSVANIAAGGPQKRAQAQAAQRASVMALQLAKAQAAAAQKAQKKGGFASAIAKVSAVAPNSAVPGTATEAMASALIAQIKASLKTNTAHSDTMAIARTMDVHLRNSGMLEPAKRAWYSYFLSMTASAPHGSDLQMYFATLAAILAF